MTFENRTFKKAILAASFAVAALAGVTTAASAHQSYTRCDSDGDRCWRVICDDDGDDCRRVSSNWDNNRGYWNNGWNNGYGRNYGGWDRDRAYDRHGRWVCDSDGDRCRWVTYSWSRWDR
jgi:hypothetical protein